MYQGGESLLQGDCGEFNSHDFHFLTFSHKGKNVLKKFGIKEAAKAGVFAKSVEQKETVFAMLGLMGVPVVIKDQVDKLRKKFSNKIYKKYDKLDTLNEKKHEVQATLKVLEIERDGIEITAEEWDISDIR